jgi:hypothetical protein
MIQDSQEQPNQPTCRLELFITSDCPSCVNAQDVANKAAAQFPELQVSITNLDMPDAVVPDTIFAVPTFCLDGRIISLGTPDWRALKQKIRSRTSHHISGDSSKALLALLIMLALITSSYACLVAIVRSRY